MLEKEITVLRTTSGVDAEFHDINELPNWAIDYVEKLHELAGPVYNCPTCGDIFSDYCCSDDLCRGAIVSAVTPIVADPFIYDN